MAWVCLMYHDVVPGTPGKGGGGRERFSVSLESFERMLDAIVDRGRVGCSLSRALDMEDGACVAITFDDGTVGQFRQAVPALRARGMTATFFVTTDWVGKPGYMSWDELRQLTRWGMSVQSHTRSHPHLSEVDRDRLAAELTDSKAAIDRELEQDTTQIALPGGDRPRAGLTRAFEDAGYEVVATSRWGRNSAAGSRMYVRTRWIRRCNAPRSLSPALARRIVTGDVRLTMVNYSREAVLNGVRSALGADRYARWRRRVLDTLERGPR